MKRFPRSFWINTVLDFQSSGMQFEAYCDRHGLLESSLKRWLKILGTTHAPVSIDSDELVEIKTNQQKSWAPAIPFLNGQIIIRNHNGWTIEIPCNTASGILEAVFKSLGLRA